MQTECKQHLEKTKLRVRIITHGSHTPVVLLSVAMGQYEPRGHASRTIFPIPKRDKRIRDGFCHTYR